MDEPLFSILIVNFNGRRHLPPCLTALERQTLPRHRFEVVVVDNGSADGSLDLVRESFPWVRTVALGGNAGFTGGNNAGLPFLRGRSVVLLNNDTVPDPHWLAELPADAPAVSKLVLEADPGVVNSAGLQLLRDGRGFDRGFRAADDGRFEAAANVFAGCGAAVVFDRKAVGTALFDPRLFLYYEDLDAAWRAGLAGRTTTYAPRSLVRHVLGGTAGDETPLFRFQIERNRTLTALRNGDPFLAVWTAVGQVARFGRSVLRAIAGRERWRLVGASADALLAVIRHAPAVAVERFVVRSRPNRASGGA